MGNIGGGEILLVLLVALIVLGPTKLPEAMRQLGRAVGEVKRMSNSFQSELKAATEFNDDAVEARARQAGAEATAAAKPAAVSMTSPLSPPSSDRPRQIGGTDDGLVDEAVAVDDGLVDEPVPDDGLVDEPVPDDGLVDEPVPDDGLVDEAVAVDGLVDEAVAVDGDLAEPAPGE